MGLGIEPVQAGRSEEVLAAERPVENGQLTHHRDQREAYGADPDFGHVAFKVDDNDARYQLRDRGYTSATHRG